MANIPAGVIFVWAGTNATIPTGWVRETSLDSKFPKATATGVNPNVAGGASTHNHTSPAHAHTIQTHAHTITISGITGNVDNNGGDTRNSATDHTGHGAFSSGAVDTGGLTSVASVYSSYSNNPPYYAVIFIKPSADIPVLPYKVISFYDNATLPAGFAFCNGASSTPDLRNKYLLGASAGADAGATGGSLSNTHDLTHTHSVTLHTHAAATSGAANGYSQRSVGGSGYVNHAHTHSVSLNAPASDPLTGSVVTLSPAETVEPAYTKLIPIMNTTGGNVSQGLIGMWLGALSAIPTNYILCDGSGGTIDMRGKHLKMANATSEAGNTGGSNTHTHAAQAHTHSSNGAHTHTANGMGHVSELNRTGSGNSTTPATAVHTAPTVATGTAVYNNANTTADSSNNEPAYLTVAFIKLMSVSGGGFFLTMMY